MNAFFREITPGMRGVSVNRPRGSDDLHDVLESIDRRVGRIDALLSQMATGTADIKRLLNNGAFNVSHVDDARAIDGQLAEAERALS